MSKRAKSAAEYRRRNPLGGPAKMFRVIAARIEAGEEYCAVLADYGISFAPAPVRKRARK